MKNRIGFKKSLLSFACLSFLFMVPQHGQSAFQRGSWEEITVSKDGFLRIEIDQDIIKDVAFYPPEAQSHFQLHEMGYLFGSGLTTPIYLTLLTAEGGARDVKLIPQKQAPCTIRLTAHSESHEEKPSSKETTLKTMMQRWMKTFVGGQVPCGFQEKPFQDLEKRFARHVQANPDHVWVHQRGMCIRYHVTGPADTPLDAALFGRPGDLAAAFDESILSASGAYLYVICHVEKEKTAVAEDTSLSPQFPSSPDLEVSAPPENLSPTPLKESHP